MPDLLQRALALLIGLPSLPVILLLAVVIRLDSPGGSFYVTTRNGTGGSTFRLFKLRTMRQDASQAGALSLHQDPRVTTPGRLLRRTHLDELPQLWNVVRGEMLLVGPRPEDARYIDMSNPLHRRVFTAKPGITGLTQLVYAREAEFLDPTNPDIHYLEKILPGKLALDARYLELRSVPLDAWILAQTALTAIGRPPTPHELSAKFGVRYGLEDTVDDA